MAVFRIEKNKNYTVMSNYHLKNSNLSLKAKGLMSLLLSLPENWDYSVEGLSSICKESKNTINGILNELQENGYLKRQVIRVNGKIADWEYIIYENKTLENSPYLKNEDIENQDIENCTQLNTNILNTNNKENNKESFGTKEKELYITELFEKFYKVYARHDAKIKGYNAFKKKLIRLKTKDDILNKARNIAKAYSISDKNWKELGTEKKYIPLCSSWINANIPD